ncbi:unnamed protein product [Schistosoma margrebowiei]|uniref:Uncharacterized protein n=1 Tax=Schistosoma margrebowiei TaxID=48269 RepID=A0A3P8ALU2_9TREM|nr:unnamed protein product [Schistosoma margrebowiei]
MTQSFSWYVVGSCCFPSLDLSDGHSDFFRRWWKICVCCFDVRWIHWSRPIQEFLEVFYPSVPLLLNFSDWPAFFVFDRSLWFTIFSFVAS